MHLYGQVGPRSLLCLEGRLATAPPWLRMPLPLSPPELHLNSVYRPARARRLRHVALGDHVWNGFGYTRATEATVGRFNGQQAADAAAADAAAGPGSAEQQQRRRPRTRPVEVFVASDSLALKRKLQAWHEGPGGANWTAGGGRVGGGGGGAALLAGLL